MPIPKIFISYSHFDSKFWEEFQRFLDPYVREDQIQACSDTDLRVGDDWHGRIQTAIEDCSAAVLFVSQDYLASDYVLEHEIQPLVQAACDGRLSLTWLAAGTSTIGEQISSVPVVDRDGSESRVSISKFQGYNPKKVLRELTPAERERIYKQMAVRIMQLFEEDESSQQESKGIFERVPRSREEEIEEVQNKLQESLRDGYAIHGLLGVGQTNLIYRASDQILDRPVAIKVRSPYHLRSAIEDTAHFEESVRVAAHLKHRCIVSVYTGRLSAPLPYIVMEFVDGVALNRVVRALGVQPFRNVQLCLSRIGSAIKYAQRKGFVRHRLHPSNILIDRQGYPVISPFRLSGDEDYVEDPDKISKSVLKYLSPEQWRDEVVSEASAQYGLGLIAYEMMIGRPYIDSENHYEIMERKKAFIDSPPPISAIRPNCPPPFSEAIARMLSERPEDRFRTLRDAVNAIRRVPFTSELPSHGIASGSFARCRESDKFFSEFYEGFFRREPAIRERFPENLEEQSWLLREALDRLLLFPSENPPGEPLIEPTILGKVGATHGQECMAIPSGLYDVFIENLVETVAAHDPKCAGGARDRILEAWRETVAPGVAYLKSMS